MNTSIPPSRALLLVILIWAAIYLPGLGTLEIKGEEGRRILPAVTMLQTGNYIVPQVGSDPYFSKPPLVNWLIAASFEIFGKRNEWAARLPSVLCVLAVAIAFVTVARGSLGPSGSLIGAIVWMTNFGMIEKGRLIEIEALYVSLCGLAFIYWLSWWQERRSPWLTWIVPWIFLGLGLLAKGPLQLVFFYAVILAVLYRAGELRALLHPAHLAGIVLMLGVFAAWAIPCLQIMQGGGVTDAWARQFSGRLSGEDFKLSGWLMNIPRGLGYFLPWVVLLLFAKGALARKEPANVERRTPNLERRTTEGLSDILPNSTFNVQRSTFDVQSGLLWGIALSFLGVSLLPGSLARYTMPLLVPAAWLTAMLLSANQIGMPGWLQLRRPTAFPAELRLSAITAAIVCIAIALYAFAAMPFLRKREKVRNIAAEINASIPAAVPLYAVDPDYQPFLFYVRDPIMYLRRVTDAPATAHYLLVQARDEALVAESNHWHPQRARPILRVKDYRKKEVTVFEVSKPSD